jgi:uncharacterized membrane protein
MVLPNLHRVLNVGAMAWQNNRATRSSLILYMAQHTKDGIATFLHSSTRLITAGGGVVLTVGFALAVINMLVVCFNSITGKELPLLLDMSYSSAKATSKKEATFGRVRLQLGELTALGLEILVVADVMESLCLTPEAFNWSTLGKMASIAVFRTALAVALGREVSEIGEKIEEEESRSSRHSKPMKS